MRFRQSAGTTCFAVLALAVALPAAAVTVDRQPSEVTQPDGSTLTVVPVGDEFNVFWELPSGHTVVRDGAGWWRIARLDAEGRLVAGPQRADGLRARAAGPLRAHLRPTRRGDGPGELAAMPFGSRTAEVRALAAGTRQPLLVILVEFNDRAPIGASAADFQQAFFGTGRSVASYYRDVTFGALDMVPAVDGHGAVGDGVVGWFKLAMNHPNRGINGSSTATDAEKNQAAHDIRLAVKAAIEAADPYVDFAAYDRDGDGGIARDELGVVVVTAPAGTPPTAATRRPTARPTGGTTGRWAGPTTSAWCRQRSSTACAWATGATAAATARSESGCSRRPSTATARRSASWSTSSVTTRSACPTSTTPTKARPGSAAGA
jgi:hypothetical protein